MMTSEVVLTEGCSRVEHEGFVAAPYTVIEGKAIDGGHSESWGKFSATGDTLGGAVHEALEGFSFEAAFFRLLFFL